jgi:sortase B
MRNQRPKKKTTLGDVIWRLVFLTALLVFCFCAYQLIHIYLEYKKGTDEYAALENEYVIEETENWETIDPEKVGESKENGNTETISSETEPVTEPETETEIVRESDGTIKVKVYPVMKNPIDFESLLKVNEDIIGWIRLKGLGISYPIAQAEDNDYYLHRTFERAENFAGCIFMEYQNQSDFSDKNTIIYGHNMKNGSMFGRLKEYYEDGVYESTPYFWIYTPEKIYRYDIISCAEVESVSDAYQITFEDDHDFMEFVDKAFARSVVDTQGIEVSPEDRIVTLSTCTGNDATRFIVQGKLSRTYLAAKNQ